jgi:hypothetical protein
MSIYEEVEYKSFYEKKIQQIPTNEVKQNFQEEFVESFKNFKVDEIKNMMYLNPKEEIKFDFMFNKADVINDDFFKNNNIFNDKASVEEKIEFMIDFIESTYEIVTPKILKQIFEELLGIINLDMSEDDYESMIYQMFNKYQINLKDKHDKNVFINFLNESFEQESEEIKNVLPSVNKSSNEKVQSSGRSNLKQRESNNKILI